MAIAGGATVAYHYRPVTENIVRVERTTRLRSECAAVPDAMAAVLAGSPATVAGDDAWDMRDALTKAGKAVTV